MKQISKHEEVCFSGHPYYVFSVRYPPEYFTREWGIQFEEFEESGLGMADMALLITETEELFAMIHYRQAPYTKFTNVETYHPEEDWSDLVDRILIELKLKMQDLLHINLLKYRFRPTSLYREDDHGTEVLIHQFDSYPDAMFRKAELEAHQHKQHYRVQIDRVAPRGWTGGWRETDKG